MNAEYPAIGRRLLAMADELRTCSEEAGSYTRTYLSPAHREAAGKLKAWMQEAGMTVREDSVGNVIGRVESKTPGARTLVTGSHFDTVRNAGKYDGVLGVILPIEVAKHLRASGKDLPFTLEVVGFADEEGVRFATSFLGSSAYIGKLDPQLFGHADEDGVSFADALEAAGFDVFRAGKDARGFDDVMGFVEVHIEQGPVLLNEGLPLGVVTAIAGASRYRVSVRGEAGHAGTVPMPMRRDALNAAAEMALAVEAVAARQPDKLVATVGKFQVDHAAANVIPGHVEFSIDIRSGDDAVRRLAEEALRDAMGKIAARRNVTLDLARYHETRATPCAPALQERWSRAIAATGTAVRALPSGAGHDAMMVAEVTPVAMLFVRCGAGGISHNPKESLTAEDAGLAAQAFAEFLVSYSRD